MPRRCIRKVITSSYNEYPSGEQLKKLTDWDIEAYDLLGLLLLIKDIWWMPEWGYRLYNENKSWLILELNSGSWLGNEIIIEALKENKSFWLQLLTSCESKGRYIFRFSIGDGG